MTTDWLVEAAWKGAAVLVLTFVVARTFGRSSAAAKHFVWSLGFVGVLTMPFLVELVPWRVRLPVALTSAVTSPVWQPALDPGLADAGQSVPPDAKKRQQPQSAAEPGAGLPPEPRAPSATPVTARFASLAAQLWIVGFFLFGGRLLIGVLSLGLLVRRGKPLNRPEWMEAVRGCARRLGVRSAPRLVLSPRVTMPCTGGLFRPSVLLPPDALQWDGARREVVLLHELAHVRRRDFLPHLLAQVACAVHWFNPLVWLGARRLRSEAERASDDLVVGSGAKPSDYAAHLLDIVRGSPVGWHPASLLPMAHRSEFEGRLLAILDSTGGRGMPTWRTVLAATSLMAAVVLPVAAARAAAPAKAVALNEAADTEGTASAEAFVEGEVDVTGSTAGPSKEARKLEPGIGQETDESQATSAALAVALTDPVAAVRRAAAEALGSARDTIAVRALMEALRRDTDVAVRRSAAWALGQIEDPLAIPALGEALRGDTDTQVRKNAAWALGEIEHSQAVPLLSEALRGDADVEVRAMAAWGLGAIEDPAGVDALIAVLDRGQDPSIRKAAIEGLSSIEDARAVPGLLPILRDPDPVMRRAAAEALGSIEDRGAVDGLMAAIRDDHVEVRRAVVEALGSIEDRRAVSALGAALADQDVDVRRKAAEAIGGLDDLSTAPPELIRALQDGDRQVRVDAVQALGDIEDPAAVPGLLRLLRDPDVELRRAVVQALDDIDDPAATSALRDALRDEDPEVRRLAAKALGNRSK